MSAVYGGLIQVRAEYLAHALGLPEGVTIHGLIVDYPVLKVLVSGDEETGLPPVGPNGEVRAMLPVVTAVEGTHGKITSWGVINPDVPAVSQVPS